MVVWIHGLYPCLKKTRVCKWLLTLSCDLRDSWSMTRARTRPTWHLLLGLGHLVIGLDTPYSDSTPGTRTRHMVLAGLDTWYSDSTLGPRTRHLVLGLDTSYSDSTLQKFVNYHAHNVHNSFKQFKFLDCNLLRSLYLWENSLLRAPSN